MGDELMDLKPKIKDFINSFKKGYEVEYEKSFTNGNCYFFSLILNHLYPEGRIYYDVVKGHFIYDFQDEIYDITGRLNKNKFNNLVAWDTFSMNYDPMVYRNILRDCVYKIDYNDWLKFKEHISNHK